MINVNEFGEWNKYEYLKQFVSKECRKRADKFYFVEDAKRTVGAELLVRYYLRLNYNTSNRKIEMEYNQYGKPYIKNSNDLYFNISHSCDWIICAWSNHEIGVDLENIRHIDLDIARVQFCNDEYTYIIEFPELSYRRFMQIWTLKESYIKYIGKGLNIPLNSFSVNFDSKELMSVYPNGKEFFENASELCGLNLIDICSNASEEKLKETRIAQLSTVVYSVALYDFFVKENGILPKLFAGHSVGEYAALIASGMLSPHITGIPDNGMIYPQIVDKVQRILFLQAKDINWDANVWYLERFQFDITRYDPTRPVKRISFLDILDKHNREYLKMYVKYQLGVTGAAVQNIWARTYITKAFLRFLDKEKLAVDKLTAAEIDLYMRELQKECVEIATFNDKVAEIHCFFRFLTARGYYSKVPFYSEYYIKREPVPHHYRSVPQNTVTEILQNLNQLPEDMRLMYLHLWCLGLRINEVCSIKREGYYLKEGVAWLRIYQHKMKMEKVIPIPMILYRSMMVYIERKKIGIDSYVFQNSKGGPFLSTHYWHEMVAWCKKQGIRCGDHVFQTHDYRHSVATALYERGASIQAIREFLGHKHENMTRRYIDCIQKHVDMSSEQYYKEQKSLVSEWKERSDKDGN